jgi:hypothetical protein
MLHIVSAIFGFGLLWIILSTDSDGPSLFYTYKMCIIVVFIGYIAYFIYEFHLKGLKDARDARVPSSGIHDMSILENAEQIEYKIYKDSQGKFYVLMSDWERVKELTSYEDARLYFELYYGEQSVNVAV